MRSLRRTRQARGFTLLELICVLALMGALSAVGLNAATSWLRMGYAEEVRLNLHTLSDLVRGQPGALQACAAHPAQPPTGPVPWQRTSCFDRLGFRLESTRFQYEIAVPGPDGADFVVRARADFDADGKPSLYELPSNRNDIVVREGLE
jgi:prepilin-type N-terminal cleavage/methylation domain-containing protein